MLTKTAPSTKLIERVCFFYIGTCKPGSGLMKCFCPFPPGDINGACDGVPRIQRVSVDAAHSAAGEEEAD